LLITNKFISNSNNSAGIWNSEHNSNTTSNFCRSSWNNIIFFISFPSIPSIFDWSVNNIVFLYINSFSFWFPLLLVRLFDPTDNLKNLTISIKKIKFIIFLKIFYKVGMPNLVSWGPIYLLKRYSIAFQWDFRYFQNKSSEVFQCFPSNELENLSPKAKNLEIRNDKLIFWIFS